MTASTTTRETCPRCGKDVVAGVYLDPTLACPGESPMQMIFWTAWFTQIWGTEIQTVDGPLFINHKHNLENPREGCITLTEDGRAAHTSGWCQCDDDPEWVRYERYSVRGREAHGYVCKHCRYLTQTG
jgi:hypothetical protein